MLPSIRVLARPLALALTFLSPSLARAEEVDRDRPWAELDGRNAGAVGVCPTDEISEHTGCYLLRCEPSRGPVFVIQDSWVTDFRLRRITLRIGRYREAIRLDGQGPDERSVALKGHPKLLAALISGQGWADFEAERYSTGFSLEAAKTLVEEQAARCSGRPKQAAR